MKRSELDFGNANEKEMLPEGTANIAIVTFADEPGKQTAKVCHQSSRAD